MMWRCCGGHARCSRVQRLSRNGHLSTDARTTGLLTSESDFARSAERRGVLRDFQAVEVQVVQREIEMGARAHGGLPGVLMDWLQKEAVVQGSALVLDE